jgi:AcrR family transcriptional regulator
MSVGHISWLFAGGVLVASTPLFLTVAASRRARRRAEIRERIFRAALRLFAARGFNGTTVHDITEAADVGKGTFFNYFPTKDHLLAAFSSMQLGKVEAVLRQAAVRREPAARVLRRMARALAEEPGRSPALVRVMLAGLLTAPAARALMLANLRRGQKLLARWLVQCRRRGEIRHGIAPRRLARNLQQSFLGALILWALEPSGRLADRLEDSAAMLWADIGTDPHRQSHRVARRRTRGE